jgi:hypothetical protein
MQPRKFRERPESTLRGHSSSIQGMAEVDPHLPLVAIEQGAGHAAKPTFAPAGRRSEQRYINVQRLEVAAAAASG